MQKLVQKFGKSGERGSSSLRMRLAGKRGSATRRPAVHSFMHPQVNSVYALKHEYSALLKGSNTNSEAGN